MLKHLPERIIGTFEGEMPGPLVIVISALHGNEPAGVLALENVFQQLSKARAENPKFQFRGKLLGLVGNLQAFQRGQRFLEQDLNRVWTLDYLQKALAQEKTTRTAEPLEVVELFEVLSQAIQSAQYSSIVILDLHTTSAEGGVFSIPTDEGKSLTLAKRLGAPAILGLQESIVGTLLGFAMDGHFNVYSTQSAETRIKPVCIAFEAGQHENPHSVNRSAFAVIRCLWAMQNLSMEDLNEDTLGLPLPFLSDIPPVVRLRYAHHIGLGDGFRMRPGYANFQPIHKGEHLADDVRGPVLSPDNGLILMPLYQAKGSDGFFIVQ